MFNGGGNCFMGADYVSWERNMFHGGFKVQNIGAKCHEEPWSVVACSRYVQRQR